MNYLKAFIDFCSAEKLPLDFVSAHPYPTYWPLDTFGNEQMGYMSKNCNIEHLDLIRDIIDHSPYPNAEIHLTEYNTSPSPRDLIHDTLFPAPFLLYNLTQNIGKVDSLGFWTFTDIFEENGPGESQFHGGFGLMNVLGIRKPSYFAYKFLADMGSNLVYRDENCFATKKDEKLHILLWNYCYYSDALQAVTEAPYHFTAVMMCLKIRNFHLQFILKTRKQLKHTNLAGITAVHCIIGSEWEHPKVLPKSRPLS